MRMLERLGLRRGHCSFFPGSGTVVDARKGDPKECNASKGTIRLDTERPLPASLLKKTVGFRYTEIAANNSMRRAGQYAATVAGRHAVERSVFLRNQCPYNG